MRKVVLNLKKFLQLFPLSAVALAFGARAPTKPQSGLDKLQA